MVRTPFFTSDGHNRQVEDLRSSLDFLLANPDTKPEGNAAVYGAAAAIPDELLDDILRGYVDVLMKVKPA